MLKIALFIYIKIGEMGEFVESYEYSRRNIV